MSLVDKNMSLTTIRFKINDEKYEIVGSNKAVDRVKNMRTGKVKYFSRYELKIFIDRHKAVAID